MKKIILISILLLVTSSNVNAQTVYSSGQEAITTNLTNAILKETNGYIMNKIKNADNLSDAYSIRSQLLSTSTIDNVILGVKEALKKFTGIDQTNAWEEIKSKSCFYSAYIARDKYTVVISYYTDVNQLITTTMLTTTK